MEQSAQQAVQEVLSKLIHANPYSIANELRKAARIKSQKQLVELSQLVWNAAMSFGSTKEQAHKVASFLCKLQGLPMFGVTKDTTSNNGIVKGLNLMKDAIKFEVLMFGHLSTALKNVNAKVAQTLNTLEHLTCELFRARFLDDAQMEGLLLSLIDTQYPDWIIVNACILVRHTDDNGVGGVDGEDVMIMVMMVRKYGVMAWLVMLRMDEGIIIVHNLFEVTKLKQTSLLPSSSICMIY